MQRLIAQARQTRDLWQGSFLLSRLMEAALSVFGALQEEMSKQEVVLVFPAEHSIDRTQLIPDLPNKYLAIFSSLALAEQTVRHSMEAIHHLWQTLCSEVWADVQSGLSESDRESADGIWQRQTRTDAFFDMSWVIVERREEFYRDWIARGMQALDARKRLRDFLPQDEPGEKSTLSGEREALHGQGDSRREVRAFWQTLAGRYSAKDLAPDGSERLDAIDMVKRFAFTSQTFLGDKNLQRISLAFPSTSTMAALPFIINLVQRVAGEPEEELWKVLDLWRNATSELRMESDLSRALPVTASVSQTQPQDHSNATTMLRDILSRDGDCFYRETFTPDRFRASYGSRSPAISDNLQGIGQILQQLYTLLGSHPTPYYALLQMDGDNMGQTIGSVQSIEEHMAISRTLSQFARQEVPRIVQQQHPGRLIYAGGDDVLALHPLSQLLETSWQLQSTYHDYMARQIREMGGNSEKATVSMGIAIAHHLMPLSLVRQAAQQAEEKAKRHYGRNALVITLLWRSGSELSAGCKWWYVHPDVPNASIQPLTILEDFLQLFARNQLSPRCLQVLESERVALAALPQEAQVLEIGRVLERQWTGEKGRTDEEKQQFRKEIRERAEKLVTLARVINLMQQQPATTGQAGENAGSKGGAETPTGLQEICTWLQIMAFLAREGGANVHLH